MFAKGMSLIEVLVASFILVTGIVCMLALQTGALSMGIVSAHRQQASLLLLELSELAYLSAGAWRDTDPLSLIYSSPAATEGADICEVTVECAADMFAVNALRAWGQTVHVRLPEAQIDIQHQWQDGYLIWAVTLSWHGPKDFSQSSLQAELSI